MPVAVLHQPNTMLDMIAQALSRDHDRLSPEEAHWRLSTYPAQAAGLKV